MKPGTPPAASASALTLSWPEPDIALLTFDLPGKGANILSRSVLLEMADHLRALSKRKDVAGLIIISGKPDIALLTFDLPGRGRTSCPVRSCWRWRITSARFPSARMWRG